MELKGHYHAHTNPSVVPTGSQTKPVHILPISLRSFLILSNTILYKGCSFLKQYIHLNGLLSMFVHLQYEIPNLQDAMSHTTYV
jgi:hypothetical protein